MEHEQAKGAADKATRHLLPSKKPVALQCWAGSR